MARDNLNRNFRILDFTGGKDHPSAGTGWVEEIVTWVERQASQGRPLGGLVIDYAGRMARRHLLAKGLDLDRHLMHKLSSIVEELIQKIADPYEAQVWILHQFNTAANKKSPASLLHHADAQWAGNFGEACDYCFCLSNKDKASGCVRFNASKNRHTEGRQLAPLLKIAGEYSRLEPATDWVFDESLRKIVPLEDVQQWHGDTSSSSRPTLSLRSQLGNPLHDVGGM